jgi:hypothetical protein
LFAQFVAYVYSELAQVSEKKQPFPEDGNGSSGNIKYGGTAREAKTPYR